MKVAIYTRVSTVEQNVDNQIIELEKYCKSRNFEIFKVYADKGVSGAKESRPEFDLMLQDANKRRFDCLLVWKLDRLSRSLKHLLTTLDSLSNLNISFVCYNDNIDTTTPAGRLMFQMVGAFAEFERALIKERVCLGLRRAKQQGKILGRPKSTFNKELAKELLKTMTMRDVANRLKVSPATICRINH